MSPSRLPGCPCAFIHAPGTLLSRRAAEAGPGFVFAYLSSPACLICRGWSGFSSTAPTPRLSRSPGCSCSAPSFNLGYTCACSALSGRDLSVVYRESRAAPGRCCRRSRLHRCCARNAVRSRHPRLIAVRGPGIVGFDLDARHLRVFSRAASTACAGGVATFRSIVELSRDRRLYGVKLLASHPVVLD